MEHKSRSKEEHRSRAETLLKGGGHSAVKQEKTMIEKAFKEHDSQLHGGAKTHLKLATGGPAKPKGKSVTNVIIHTGQNPAAQQQAQQQGMQQGMRAGALLGARAAAQKMGQPAPGGAPGGPPPGAPPMGPQAGPPGGAPGGAPGGGMPPGAGMRPPGMKRGGAMSSAMIDDGRSRDTSTKKREGDWKNTNGLATGGVAAPDSAGAGSGLGRLQKQRDYGASGPTGGSPAAKGVTVPTVKVKAHERRKGGAC